MSRKHKHPMWVFILGLSVFTLVCAAIVNAQQTEEVELAEDQAEAAAADAKETDDAEVVEFPDTEENEEVPGNNNIEARPVSPARKEALKRRAGEKVGGNPRGRANILGMHIQEADNERARVVEVAPTSAAFDAGIRKGDEIVSFDGFKATKYREWIDGMRKLATDAPDGDTIPIILVRDEKRLNLRIRMPVPKVGPLPPTDDVTLNQPIPGQPGQPGVVVPGQQQAVPYGVGGGGDNILIADTFGDDFNSPEGGSTESAIAELVLLNTPEQAASGADVVNQQGSNQLSNQRGAVRGNSGARSRSVRAPADAPGGNTPGGNIGLAGFRNDANGMFVMLDVGGLPPGNYLVGIDDPSVMMGSGGNQDNTLPNNVQNVRREAGSLDSPNNATPQPGTPPSVVPRQGVPRQGGGAVPPPSGAAPAAQPNQQRPAGNVNPQGRVQPPAERRFEIPRSVLAQVADSSQAASATGGGPTPGATPTDIPATGQAQPLDTPATGNAQTLDTPATGQTRLSGATATGLPRGGDPRQNPNLADDPAANAGAGPTLQIGTLTVDQSGTGRLQQVVEAVRVQDIVGQAIAIYSQNGASQTTLPADLNAASDPLAAQQRPTAAARNAAGGALTRNGNRVKAQPNTGNVATDAGIGNQNSTANGANGTNGNMPVAAGIIRMMSEQLPGDAGAAATGQDLPTSQSLGDAENVPQNSVVPTSPPPANLFVEYPR